MLGVSKQLIYYDGKRWSRVIKSINFKCHDDTLHCNEDNCDFQQEMLTTCTNLINELMKVTIRQGYQPQVKHLMVKIQI